MDALAVIALGPGTVNGPGFRCPMKSIIALVSLLLLSSCAGVDTRRHASLVGNWLYADAVQSCRYSFEADGTFRGEVRLNERPVSRFKGTWAVKGDALLYTYLSDVFGRIPAGATDRDQLLEIGNDSFLIQAANGEQRRYRRVR
jgi:hypothetical protein